MVKINGIDFNAAGQPLTEYLSTNGYNPTRIAIEYNGEILPKAQYAETILADGDEVEIVNFVGGG